MLGSKTLQSGLNEKLQALSTSPCLENGLQVANAISQLLGLEHKDIETVKESVVSLPSFGRYKSWFKKHPVFNDERACFALGSNQLIETKFYDLQKQSRQIIAGSVGFEFNFEDENFTRNEGFKVGLDFFLAPDNKSLQVVLSDRGNLRLVELADRLTQTQVEIFTLWLQAATCTNQAELHHLLWDSFKLKSVNQKFYDGISRSFNILLEHLKNIGKEEESAKLFANRLFGRLLFCWFLRKKEIINEEMGYFSDCDQFDDATDYYRLRLEPLFFQTLNRPLNERSRTEKAPSKLTPAIDDSTPYLNGGLFEIHENDWFQDSNLTFPKDFFRNIYNHFDEFNFTTDESSLEYEQIAIDPEMLGRIFESFLAEQIDESTGQQARKAKGAYYTPREIVSYMCKESVRDYLLKSDPDNERYIEAVNKLLDTSDQEWGKGVSNSKLDKVPKEFVEPILTSLDNLKILDPACGSGAFPMGILQLCLRIYERLANGFNAYRAKLQIIQNNIFGSDIEPMAIEIARLRVWLSLVVDSKDESKIQPLPNLNFNFVCANSLMSLEKNALGDNPKLYDQLREIIRNYFQTHGAKTKQKLQKDYYEKINIQQMVLASNRTEQLKSFDPFKNDKPASFFDTGYMFGVPDFDIVIGNPPYIQLQKNRGKLAKQYVNEGFQCFASTGDIYQLFFEQGLNFLKDDGVLCYITSNKWMRAAYGMKMRRLFADTTRVIQLIDLGSGVFDATVDTNILILKKSIDDFKSKACKIEKSNFSAEVVRASNIVFNAPDRGQQWLILNPIERSIKDKIERIGTPLKEWDINIYYGIKTGYNEAFIINNETKDRLVAQDPKSAEILKPILRGRDIKRYRADWAELWLIGTMPSLKINIEEYPAVKKYLLEFGRERLEQTGKTSISGVRSRKKTGHKWFELQDSCAYYGEFENRNIVWQRVTRQPAFCFSKPGQHVLDSMVFISGNQENLDFILPILNSSTVEHWVDRNAHQLGEGGYLLSNQYIERMPVPKLNECDNSLIEDLLKNLKGQLKIDSKISHSIIDSLVYKLFQFTPTEIKVIEESFNK